MSVLAFLYLGVGGSTWTKEIPQDHDQKSLLQHKQTLINLLRQFIKEKTHLTFSILVNVHQFSFFSICEHFAPNTPTLGCSVCFSEGQNRRPQPASRAATQWPHPRTAPRGKQAAKRQLFLINSENSYLRRRTVIPNSQMCTE